MNRTQRISANRGYIFSCPTIVNVRTAVTCPTVGALRTWTSTSATTAAPHSATAVRVAMVGANARDAIRRAIGWRVGCTSNRLASFFMNHIYSKGATQMPSLSGESCPRCGGTGHGVCPVCHNNRPRGTNSVMPDGQGGTTRCTNCGGWGYDTGSKCPACRGTGVKS